jgi:hypothetical protein
MSTELSELCREKFKQLDKHIEESGPIREDVATLKQTVRSLQDGYAELIKDVKEIKNILLNRPPAWVSVAIGGLMSICTGLIVFLATH